MAFIVKREIIVPTTLPLGTPNLYFSGLVMPDNGPWSGMTYDNPWTWVGFGWASSTFGELLYWNNQGDEKWWFAAYGYNSIIQDYVTRIACSNSAPAGALPLIGWVNESWVTGGTLIISTTP